MSTKKNRVIRRTVIAGALGAVAAVVAVGCRQTRKSGTHGLYICLLYTSDAADE